MAFKTQLYIDGKFVDPVLKGTFDTINPATEEVICTVSGATAEDIELAVQSCVRAVEGPNWGYNSTGAQRAGYLRKLKDIVVARKGELAMIDAIDSGKPMREAEADMDDFAGICAYFADLAEEQDKIQDEKIANGTEEFTTTIKYEPIGVVACITPWNYPILMAVWKVIPALAAGCGIILKPSELAPLSCLILGEMCTQAGFPAGALNVVNGLGPTAGGPLSQHPRIDKISFTGSVATAIRVMHCAAEGPRAFAAELGGKSPLIAFADCDINATVDWAILGFLWGTGQVCSSTSRIFVHKSIKEKFLARMIERIKMIKIADTLTQHTAGDTSPSMGPVINKVQYDKIWKYIDGAKAEGLNFAYGGEGRDLVKHVNGGRGFFIPPVVIVDPPTTSSVWNEEIFGPVVCIRDFETEAEVMVAANDTEYGLAACVFSADPALCNRCVRALRVGTVWVNNGQPCFPQAPWGGCKKSGFGKDLGKWGMDEFVLVKQVTGVENGFTWNVW